MTLLRYWGDAEVIMGEYMQENDMREDFERREAESRENRLKQREREEKRLEATRKQGEEMMRLRASLDNGEPLSNEEERRLMIWEETGGELVPENANAAAADGGVRDSMALMLYQGTTGNSKMAAITMRNQKA
jgi:hypothetical protein